MPKIVTHRTECPFRDQQWCAYDDDTYCGCPDCHPVVGYGPTPEAAIADYNEKVEEEEE